MRIPSFLSSARLYLLSGDCYGSLALLRMRNDN